MISRDIIVPSLLNSVVFTATFTLLVSASASAADADAALLVVKQEYAHKVNHISSVYMEIGKY